MVEKNLSTTKKILAQILFEARLIIDVIESYERCFQVKENKINHIYGFELKAIFYLIISYRKIQFPARINLEELFLSDIVIDDFNFKEDIDWNKMFNNIINSRQPFKEFEKYITSLWAYLESRFLFEKDKDKFDVDLNEIKDEYSRGNSITQLFVLLLNIIATRCLGIDVKRRKKILVKLLLVFLGRPINYYLLIKDKENEYSKKFEEFVNVMRKSRTASKKNMEIIRYVYTNCGVDLKKAEMCLMKITKDLYTYKRNSKSDKKGLNFRDTIQKFFNVIEYEHSNCVVGDIKESFYYFLKDATMFDLGDDNEF